MTIFTGAELDTVRATIATPMSLPVLPSSLEIAMKLIVIAYIDKAFYNDDYGDTVFHQFRAGRYEGL